MKVRKAQNHDKKHIVDFCKNTFSWGDYIPEVWDYWEKEGNLLVIEEDQKAVALCHASINKPARQMWIEGIRVNPNFRRKGFAWTLVSELESIGIKNNISNSFMLIEVNNSKSISLAEKLNYKKNGIWWFYSLLPKSVNTIDYTKFYSKSRDLSDELFQNKMFVKSWRWLPLDQKTLKGLMEQNRILVSKKDTDFSITIITDSEHFDGTLIVTMYGNSVNLIEKHLRFIQNYSFEKNYSRIQIITTLDNLIYDELQKRFSFYLMKKVLNPQT